jgi:NADPH-dependent ferric siderophore reductase
MVPEPRAWQLVVKDVADLGPAVRRVQLTAPTLDRFIYLPGQDVSLGFSAADGSTVRRRYTIRAFHPDERALEINIVMHGGGPGMRWAESASPGSEIEAIGPRGKITLAADAQWHLFAGDSTAAPGAFAMIDALPSSTPALAFFRIQSADERQPFRSNGGLRTIDWQSGGEEIDAGPLLEALKAAPLPSGRGHAYIAGEVGLVSSIKAGLLAAGWSTDQISAKAYWNRGRANAGHGEPEQKVS